MKIIGVLLIIGATTWMGFIYSIDLDKRPQQIKHLTNALQILETEIKYSQTPLDQAFHFIKYQIPEPTNLLFKKISNRLSNEKMDFPMIWKDEVTKHIKNSSLKKEEESVLIHLGQTLGQYDINEQEKYLLQAKKHLDYILLEAEENKNKYSKAMKSLGALLGLFIALLLF